MIAATPSSSSGSSASKLRAARAGCCGRGGPTMKQGEDAEIGLATFVDDATRAHGWAPQV
eukprot:29492-Pyramimonas_sp.AAC.1